MVQGYIVGFKVRYLVGYSSGNNGSFIKHQLVMWNVTPLAVYVYNSLSELLVNWINGPGVLMKGISVNSTRSHKIYTAKELIGETSLNRDLYQQAWTSAVVPLDEKLHKPCDAYRITRLFLDWRTQVFILWTCDAAVTASVPIVTPRKHPPPQRVAVLTQSMSADPTSVSVAHSEYVTAGKCRDWVSGSKVWPSLNLCLNQRLLEPTKGAGHTPGPDTFR